MIYTAHVGRREDTVPPLVGQASTREAAQAIAKATLAAAPVAHTKAEVRLRAELLDCYGRRDTGTIKHTYAAKQRTMTRAVAQALPLEPTQEVTL